ncbi:NucA/NucB deoxyribonuclease domain-containing protein [Streptomyces lasiicapitis]|uniref:NucA/NucB deoxyribonuclease domain-containing protein n=1 Tax=Streptomyces lasiicapitis TaxID=1923961 RepID=UPI003649CF21
MLHKWMKGESFFGTTATAVGAKGKCGTGWTMKATNPPYNPVDFPSTFKEVRCDNATAGRQQVGCAVPWYASDLRYSKARTPDLARHVTLAQNSGLPKRLHRTTKQSVIDKNRDLACDDRPSVTDKSCDEYPVATSKEGLSAGGKRRTFDGCSYRDIPSGSGSKGASACAIAKGDNQSQGGTNTQFYRAERVLQNDPFDVVIIP